MVKTQSVHGIVDQLCAIFDESVANLRTALKAYIERGELPDPDKRASGCCGSVSYTHLTLPTICSV